MGVKLAVEVSDAAKRWELFEEPISAAGSPPRVKPDREATVRPEDYQAIVERLLFSTDRSPTAGEVDQSVLTASKSTIRLPVLRGVADLGAGPAALLAEGPNSDWEWTQPGERVGGYVLERIERNALVLSRDGRTMSVATADLRESSRGVTPSRAFSRRAPPTRADSARSVSSTGRYRIGSEFRPGRFVADPSDGAVDGTEYEDYIRRVRTTPFGAQHWWERREP